MEEKSIKIMDGKQPELKGEWTIGEIMAAVEYLQRWIAGQKLVTMPEQHQPEPAKVAE